MNMNSKPNGEMITEEMENTTPCNPSDAQMMGDSLAMVYSPKQYWMEMFPEEDALSFGTLFKQLYKPLEVVGEDRRK